jgi:endoglucanase
VKLVCLLFGSLLAFPTIHAADSSAFVLNDGGIVRGPKTEKRLALVFTAHTFAEGGEKILDELAKHHAKGSFFVTGEFLDNPQFQPLAKRIVREGHYLGPHSDKHLLYCPWDGPKKTLVTREEFESDLNHNLEKITRLGIPRSEIKYWLPAYEWYNRDIVDWSRNMGLTLVNYTPGTRSNADYLEDAAKNFISSQAIIESIEKKEQRDPHGLNGFLLLMHLGVGPARKDKLSDHFGELLDYLSGKGYQFVRVDELLRSK